MALIETLYLSHIQRKMGCVVPLQRLSDYPRLFGYQTQSSVSILDRENVAVFVLQMAAVWSFDWPPVARTAS